MTISQNELFSWFLFSFSVRNSPRNDNSVNIGTGGPWDMLKLTITCKLDRSVSPDLIAISDLSNIWQSVVWKRQKSCTSNHSCGSFVCRKLPFADFIPQCMENCTRVLTLYSFLAHCVADSVRDRLCPAFCPMVSVTDTWAHTRGGAGVWATKSEP